MMMLTMMNADELEKDTDQDHDEEDADEKFL